MSEISAGIKTCDNCKHCIIDFKAMGQKECRRWPPIMQVFLVPGPKPGSHGFLEYSGYPKVDVMKPCGEHVYRAALQQEKNDAEEEGRERVGPAAA